MLDIHKTPTDHYVNTTITDGSLLKKEQDNHQMETKNWIRRDRFSTSVSYLCIIFVSFLSTYALLINEKSALGFLKTPLNMLG